MLCSLFRYNTSRGGGNWKLCASWANPKCCEAAKFGRYLLTCTGMWESPVINPLILLFPRCCFQACDFSPFQRIYASFSAFKTILEFQLFFYDFNLFLSSIITSLFLPQFKNRINSFLTKNVVCNYIYPFQS